MRKVHRTGLYARSLCRIRRETGAVPILAEMPEIVEEPQFFVDGRAYLGMLRQIGEEAGRAGLGSPEDQRIRKPAEP